MVKQYQEHPYKGVTDRQMDGRTIPFYKMLVASNKKIHIGCPCVTQVQLQQNHHVLVTIEKLTKDPSGADYCLRCPNCLEIESICTSSPPEPGYTKEMYPTQGADVLLHVYKDGPGGAAMASLRLGLIGMYQTQNIFLHDTGRAKKSLQSEAYRFKTIGAYQ